MFTCVLPKKNMLKARLNVVGYTPAKRNQEFSADTRVSSEIVAFVVKQHSLAQRQIAGILNVHYSYISKVLKGQRNLTLTHIEAISKALGMPMPVFLWNALRPKTVSAGSKKACDGIDILFGEVYPEAFNQEAIGSIPIRDRSPGRKRRLAAVVWLVFFLKHERRRSSRTAASFLKYQS